MIKINLLPYQKAAKVKRKQALEAQVLLGVLVLVGLSAGLGFFWLALNDNIAEQRETRQQLHVQLEELKRKVKEVEDVEQRKKLVEEKIAIIAQLKKNQQGPVRVMDELSSHLPSRVWLTSLTQQGNAFDLEGRATTNFEIVDYYNKLKTSAFITDLQLIESRQGAEGSLMVYNFKLKFKVKAT
ncbi:MAG: PilN domain-containing protein [Nitrospirota bacterium]